MTTSRSCRPSWADFDERPAAEFGLRAPPAELAVLLQRLRDALDEAGRAWAEGRAEGFRALAEQAVLAVELEALLERYRPELAGAPSERAYLALAALNDRMLGSVAASGLEVVRVRGAAASEVASLVKIDCWRYDRNHPQPVVVQELEAAVRLDGATLRHGRVVMGGEREGLIDGEVASDVPVVTAGAAGRAVSRQIPPAEHPPARRVTCPIAGCGADNEATTEACVGCLTPLAGFGRVSMRAALLFNRGLQAARAGDSVTAREYFAAIVLWAPDDAQTRNAHALACLDGSDVAAARRSWEQVLEYSPDDAFALRGLAELTRESVNGGADGSPRAPTAGER